MKKPYITKSFRNYEKEIIENEIQGSEKSTISNNKLESYDIKPNVFLKRRIEK